MGEGQGSQQTEGDPGLCLRNPRGWSSCRRSQSLRFDSVGFSPQSTCHLEDSEQELRQGHRADTRHGVDGDDDAPVRSPALHRLSRGRLGLAGAGPDFLQGRPDGHGERLTGHGNRD